MNGKDVGDGILRPPGEFASPPAPSPDLMAVVRGMQPVRTRARWGAFGAVALLGLVAPAVALLLVPPRRDLAGLPVAWVILAAGLWGLSSALALTAALVPRRGDVLPAPGRASAVGTAAMILMLLFALVATIDVPGLSIPTGGAYPSLLQSVLHCVGTSLEISLPFLVLGAWVSHRVLPVGGLRVGLALGAAGGAMGGLVLHFICAIGGTAHVVAGHVGGMMLSAAVGAIVVSIVIGRR